MSALRPVVLFKGKTGASLILTEEGKMLLESLARVNSVNTSQALESLILGVKLREE